MAQITNPEDIRFVNEVIRVIAEEARAFKIRANALQSAWFLGLNSHFANSDDTIEDGREAEGVSRLTAGDVTNLVAQVTKIAEGQSEEWNQEIIQKPCVRVLP